jgi:hypothetical protein
MVTPVDSTGFFSPRSNGQSRSVGSVTDTLPAPAPFQGLGGAGYRASADSSAYSPVNSPRESFANKNGGGYGGLNSALSVAPGGGRGGGGNSYAQQPAQGPSAADSRRQAEDLKIYLEDQTAVLVQTIQNLVQLVRGDAGIEQVSEEISVITDVVEQVTAETTRTAPGGPQRGAEMVRRLADCRERLVEAGMRGRELAEGGSGGKEWKMWTQTLPPIAFEIAREMKELVARVERLGRDEDDFS